MCAIRMIPQVAQVVVGHREGDLKIDALNLNRVNDVALQWSVSYVDPDVDQLGT